MKRYSVRSISLLAIILSIFLTSTNVLAQVSGAIKYNYYGKVLTQNDILDFYHKGHNLSCIQEFTDYGIEHRTTDLYTCFDTSVEVDKYVSATKAQRAVGIERARLKDQEFANSATVSPLTSCAHWAYYATTGLGGWLFDLCNGQSKASHSTVWSIYKDTTPNDTILYCNTNFGGFNFQYSSTNWAIPSCPFAGGGAVSSKVK